jgi:ribosomal-protein-alanine N-acetyltransferase
MSNVGSAPIALPNIATGRTVLRVLKPADWALALQYELDNRQHLVQWEPAKDDIYFTEAAITRRLAQTHAAALAGTALHLAALDRQHGHQVASLNFTNIQYGVFQACHLGYSVARTQEGQGLMHEVAQAGIAHIFEHYGLHRVMAGHQPDNHRSEKLLRRLGFEREGYARSYLKINGIWQDIVLNSLINLLP